MSTALVQVQYGSYAAAQTENDAAYNERVASAFGYTAEDLVSIPQKANLGVSCGNPIAMAGLKEVWMDVHYMNVPAGRLDHTGYILIIVLRLSGCVGRGGHRYGLWCRHGRLYRCPQGWADGKGHWDRHDAGPSLTLTPTRPATK